MDERARAMVTGASAGIGEAFARVLAERGHDLVLVARDHARLEALGKELADAHGTDAEILPADLVDRVQLDTVEARIRAAERPVSVLVNNAGFGTHGKFHELPIEGEERMVDLNVVALMRLTHAALAVMVPRGEGGVLNVSSIGGYQPSPGFATYSATKAFVSSFTQAVHEEVRGTGVRVTVVCPGFTRTNFQQAAGLEASGVPGFLWQAPEQVARTALDALEKGKAVCIPGPINQVSAAFVSVLPSVLTRKAARIVTERSG